MNKEDLKSIRDNLLRTEHNPFKRFKINREYIKGVTLIGKKKYIQIKT
jgi:hypothetical protein